MRTTTNNTTNTVTVLHYREHYYNVVLLILSMPVCPFPGSTPRPKENEKKWKQTEVVVHKTVVIQLFITPHTGSCCCTNRNHERNCKKKWLEHGKAARPVWALREPHTFSFIPGTVFFAACGREATCFPHARTSWKHRASTRPSSRERAQFLLPQKKK